MKEVMKKRGHDEKKGVVETMKKRKGIRKKKERS
jgi:hypothetical protein